MIAKDQLLGPSSPRYAVIFLVAAAGVGLFVLLPYTTGYGDVRKGVLHMVSRFWKGEPDWQHGALVPPVVAFLIWHLRDRWQPLEPKGSLVGLVGVLLSLFILSLIHI